MTETIAVGRAQWLGHRWRRHGLNGRTNGGALDDLLLLGLQDGRFGGAAYSLRQRTERIGSTPLGRAIAPAGPLVSWWSMRGAPHAHRLAQLDVVRDALAPRPRTRTVRPRPAPSPRSPQRCVLLSPGRCRRPRSARP
ncbi:hypothetical protein [Nocardia xishanensis]